ncbi:DUF455-domain-containing protein [Ramicandelaber brevisporus]|nr:DUF455-domain-containing protein [Ramicandelaber brevisporus]
MSTLCARALRILRTSNPADKVSETLALGSDWRSGVISEIGSAIPLDFPPRDSSVQIVPPTKTPKLGNAGNLRSRITILHSLANVEQFAIDTALDNIIRFGNTSNPIANDPNTFGTDSSEFVNRMPKQFYDDFVRMATEEAGHFNMLQTRLKDFGSYFGALPVHTGVWDSAMATADALLPRMAIVHMVHEARGLDVNPGMIAKFRSNGNDEESAKLLELILEEEIGHVRIGLSWFSYLCNVQDIDKASKFAEIVEERFNGKLKPPFNEIAREAAGFEKEMYMPLASTDVTPPASPKKTKKQALVA